MSENERKSKWVGHYKIVSDEPDCLLIRATGPWGVSTNWKDGTPEVAEEVGARLKPGQRLEFLNFRATRRQQLVLKNGKFIGFARAGVNVNVNEPFARKLREIIKGKKYRLVPLPGMKTNRVADIGAEERVEALCSAQEIVPGVWDTIYLEVNLCDRDFIDIRDFRPDLFQGPVDDPRTLSEQLPTSLVAI